MIDFQYDRLLVRGSSSGTALGTRSGCCICGPGHQTAFDTVVSGVGVLGFLLEFGSGVWFCWLRAFVACVAGLVAGLDSENMVKANITLRDAKRLRSRRCLLRSSVVPADRPFRGRS